MGQYFLIVNLAKRLYIDADRFGDNIKRSGILNGFHGAALGLLLFDGERHGQEHALLGGWAGDPVVAAGDDAPPNTLGLITTTSQDPNRNLHGMALDEFEDISHEAIDLLCAQDSSWATEFAKRAVENRALLVELGDVVFRFNCIRLGEALQGNLGNRWEESFKIERGRYLGRRLAANGRRRAGDSP